MGAGANKILMACRLSVVPTNDAVMAVTSPAQRPTSGNSGERGNDRLRMDRSNDEQ